jgi:hypothetical protein
MLHRITSPIEHAGPRCTFCYELIVASAGDGLMVWCEEKQLNSGNRLLQRRNLDLCQCLLAAGLIPEG